jgi:hypothetical protein
LSEIRWLGGDRNVLFSKEFLHSKQCVAWCIIMMQKPLPLPLLVSLPPDCLA